MEISGVPGSRTAISCNALRIWRSHQIQQGLQMPQKSQLHAESTLITFSLIGASKTYPGVFWPKNCKLEQPEQPEQPSLTFHEGAYCQSCVCWHSPHTVSLQLLQTPLQLLLEKWNHGVERVDELMVFHLCHGYWMVKKWHKKCCRLSENIQHDSSDFQQPTCLWGMQENSGAKNALETSFWEGTWGTWGNLEKTQHLWSVVVMKNWMFWVTFSLSANTEYIKHFHINQSQLSRIETNNTYRNNIVKPKIRELLCTQTNIPTRLSGTDWKTDYSNFKPWFDCHFVHPPKLMLEVLLGLSWLLAAQTASEFLNGRPVIQFLIGSGISFSTAYWKISFSRNCWN